MIFYRAIRFYLTAAEQRKKIFNFEKLYSVDKFFQNDRQGQIILCLCLCIIYGTFKKTAKV